MSLVLLLRVHKAAQSCRAHDIFLIGFNSFQLDDRVVVNDAGSAILAVSCPVGVGV